MSDRSILEAPHVDVVILSWNRVEETIAAIESALAQEGVGRRVLVVDQGSERGQLGRLEEFLAGKDDVVLHKAGSNLGVSGGRNAAAALGCAPYIVGLDSDAVFADPGTLRRAIAHMEADQALCAIAFRISRFDSRENDWTSWDYPGRNPTERFATTRFVGAGFCVRRDLFELVGGFDERLFFCGEEVDLCYRMLSMGKRIDYVPDVEIMHRVSAEVRVHWDRGRFRLAVRNNLYTLYKFGTPMPRLLVAAISWAIRGARNGLLFEALKGCVGSLKLCAAFQRSHPGTEYYHLSPQTWRYIIDCEPHRRENIATKFRRQLRRLPRAAAIR